MFGGRLVSEANQTPELAIPDNLGGHLVDEPRVSV